MYVAQVVEHITHTCEVLGLIPGTVWPKTLSEMTPKLLYRSPEMMVQLCAICPVSMRSHIHSLAHQQIPLHQKSSKMEGGKI